MDDSRLPKDRIYYQDKINIILEEACDNLPYPEFEILKERVAEILEGYE